MRISELYMTCIHAFEEFKPLKGKGVVSKIFHDGTIVAVTADDPVQYAPNEHCMDVEIKPFQFYFWVNGWLAAIIGPSYGEMIGDNTDGAIEDRLIRTVANGGLR